MENIEHTTWSTEPPTAALCRDAGAGEEVVPVLMNGATERRLSVETVEWLHRLVGGDARVEGMALRFIADRYGAKNLLELPPHVAKEILKRPADSLRAAKNHCEPELPI